MPKDETTTVPASREPGIHYGPGGCIRQEKCGKICKASKSIFEWCRHFASEGKSCAGADACGKGNYNVKEHRMPTKLYTDSHTRLKARKIREKEITSCCRAAVSI